MAGSRLFDLGGIIKDISSGVSDALWGYFSKSENVDPTHGDPSGDILQCHLQPLYGDQTPIVAEQAQQIFQNSYHGNMEQFLTEFFYPSVNLLIKLQKDEQQNVRSSHDIEQTGTDLISSEQTQNDHWPLVVKSGVLINLVESPWSRLKSGDACFFLSRSFSDQVCLYVKCLIDGKCEEVVIPESDFGKIFTMDWKNGLMSDSTEDLGKLLHNCIVNLQDSVERLHWEDVVSSANAFNSRRHIVNGGENSFSRCNGSPSSKPKNSDAGSNAGSNKDGCTNSSRPLGLNLSEQAPVNLDQHGDKNKHVNNQDCNHGVTKASSENVGPLVIEAEDLQARKMGSTDGREKEKPANQKSPRSPRSPGLHQHRQLDAPKTILDVDYKLLQSGVAVLPGCRDRDGNAVVLVFTSSSLWKNQQVRSTDLARLIMYYYSVPRETVRCRGLTIVADIRGCTTSTINTLLESLYLFEGNVPQAISVVHLLADKHTQSLVLLCPIYDVHASFQINLLLSSNLLFTYVSPDQLPPVLDGVFQYCHEDWMRFHMRFDPFLSSCRAVAKYLVNVMQELSAVDQAPGSATEASHLVEHHENLVKAAFEDQRVKRLQNEGEAMLHSLETEEVNIGNSDDYRYAMEDIRQMYKLVTDTMLKLIRLSDARLDKLQKCLQLKGFDEECGKIISWLHSQGNECLQRHLVMADNLKGVRSQQKEFEKFYFTAMTHIEKGNDLLEEASMLAQTVDFEEVTGYKELARMLKRHLQEFSEKLESTRERIDDTTKCYHLLDKTYEWALEAMKYVASMKMEHCATADGLEKLLRSLDHYLKEHPPMADSIFSKMFEIAQNLRNDKLLEQCRTAQSRCQETQKMLTLRENTLKQFKDQLANDPTSVGVKSTTSDMNMDTNSEVSKTVQQNLTTEHRTNSKGNQWEPKNTSTPLAPKTYSRLQREKNNASSPSHSTGSPCHLPSSPCHSSITSSSYSSSSSSPVHSDTGFSESRGVSLVSGNSSHRIVTTIPKILTDASSRENRLNDSANSDISPRLSSPIHENITPTSLSQGTGNVFSSRNRPARKVLKRAITSPLPGTVILEEDPSYNDQASSRITSLRENGRTDSMITGSSDSLPSLPEEEEGIVSVLNDQHYPRGEWTPVPVNTHLTEHSCNTPTRPFADLKLSEAEIKSRRTLSLVMNEMVQTERDYVFSLRFIVENYIPEMERDDVPQALRGKRNIIFGNIEKIYQFHQQYFLQEIEASRRNPFMIARYFLMHESQFHLYTLYNKNKPKSDSLMAEFGKHFFRDKQQQLGDKMDLASYLLKPVQRMGKYALLVKQILKECPSSAPEYQELKAAEEMVRFQLRHGNDLLAMDALKDCDVNLQEQGKLLRQDEFLVFQGRRKFMRHVFLFEELILFSKTKRGRNGCQDTYTYKHSFKMSDIGLTEDYNGSGYKFEIWFRRRTAGESYVLQAPNSDMKKRWIHDLTRILWNQAIKNREHRLSELATMGIGNKPCLDIKPSADNIQDRFINIAVGNKEARTRNSIAVCSIDHLQQGNKRPHSIISVGSSSSSNSSHSGFSAMNLALHPVDSPRTYRRSLAESGIGTSITSTDMDSTLKYEDQNQPRTLFTYQDFTKPQVVNLKSRSEEMTDV